MNIPPIRLNTGRMIGVGYPTYVIAEVGSNHDGDLERAKMLIKASKEAGAHAVKFQSFEVENLINPKWKSNGQWVKDPSWELLKKLSMPNEWLKILKKTAEDVGIDFLSTPFDCEHLKLLVDLDIPAIKIASGDLTYNELLREVGKSGKPVFLSTGASTLGEVESAMKVLWETGCKEIVVFHCTSVYPADFVDVNLHAMNFMRHGFQVQVGYSDHTPGLTVPLGAVSLGASIVEKHITDDKTREGPDHPFALDLDEFAAMCRQIRELEEALINGPKMPRQKEEEMRIFARRALYAKENIKAGTTLQRDMISIIRHAYPEGISAEHWDYVNGKQIQVDIPQGDLITWDML